MYHSTLGLRVIKKKEKTHVGGEEASDKADGAGAAVEELVRVVQLDTRLRVVVCVSVCVCVNE